MKITRIVTLCLLLSLLAAPSAVAAPMTSNSVTLPRAFTTGAHIANEAAEGKSPITGLDYSGPYRPLVVQISNAKEARPHANFSEADVVYEAIYWGPGHTRYTAVYHDNHPDYVGYIRSARNYHIDIRTEWDAPFVFFGGQQASGTNIYDYFNQQGIDKSFRIDGTSGGRGFFREEKKVNPHNAVANLQEMVANSWPTNEDGSAYEPKQHTFRFSDPPTYGSESATEIHIPYHKEDYYPSYTYNAGTREYERWYNGEQQFDARSEKRIVASNVIVQFADLSYYNNTPSRPLIRLQGEGVMDAFIGGRHIRGTWQRKTLQDRTVFLDANGEEIAMLPGKTFIQVVPMSFDYSFLKDDGTEVRLDSGTDVAAPVLDESSVSLEEMDKMEGGE